MACRYQEFDPSRRLPRDAKEQSPLCSGAPPPASASAQISVVLAWSAMRVEARGRSQAVWWVSFLKLWMRISRHFRLRVVRNDGAVHQLPAVRPPDPTPVAERRVLPERPWQAKGECGNTHSINDFRSDQIFGRHRISAPKPTDSHLPFDENGTIGLMLGRDGTRETSNQGIFHY